jgi:beta-glucosidase
VVWPKAEIPPRPSGAALEQRVQAILARMSLEQKIGQMIEAEIKSASPADVKTYHLGSVLNGGGSTPNGNIHASVADWVSLADRFYDASMDVSGGLPAIPVIWGVDAVHGHNNVFGDVLYPHNIGLGASGDADLAEKIGAAVAADVRATGINWAYAPTLAVVQNPRWGRSYESFGQDPALVKRLGEHFVMGLQGAPGASNQLDQDHVIATAKHYIGDGGTTDGVDQGDYAGSEAELRDRDAAGYYGALKADVQTVMVSFSSWRGEKLHAQKHLITDVLKGQMGFDGFVVSDWNAIGQVAGCSNVSCPAAINAGIDMIMAPNDWKALYGNMLAEAKSGVIPAARIDDAVSRILRVKLRAGMFEAGKPSVTAARARTGDMSAQAHRALARQAVRQSLVLLKNKGHILPLSGKLNLLVAGDGADNIPRQSGGWSLTWQGSETTNADFPGATSIWQGLSSAVKAAGGTATLSPDGAFTTRPDAAIVVFGERPYAEGQGDARDLGWSNHSRRELELIRKLKAANIPVVTVFLSGRPRWTNPEINASDAFVAAWLPGTDGAGVADLLIKPVEGAAAYDFTGRLSFAWPATAAPPKLSGLVAEGAQFQIGYGLTLKGADEGPGELPEVSGVAEVRDLSLTHFYDRGPVSPWRVFVGDMNGWQTPVTATQSTSASQILTVTKIDHVVQEDGLRATWNGKGLAQVYLQSAATVDWSDLFKARQMLVFSLKVFAKPTAPVFIRQDCVYPCGAKADMTRLMNAVPLDQWVRVSIDQKCFVKFGLDPKKVETSFLLATTGKFDAAISYIDLEPVGTGHPTIACE